MSGHAQVYADITPFTDETMARGLGNFTLQWYLLSGFNGGGYGLAFGDLNNNGSPDLVAVGSTNFMVGLWENDGTGHFINRAFGSGVPSLPQPSAIAMGDYNGDGMLDLFIAQRGQPNYLLKNLGGFKFENVSAPAGIIQDLRRVEDAKFTDYNGDGWIDLYVVNYCMTLFECPDGINRMYRNNADGTFTDVAPELGLNDPGLGFHAVFFDFNRDGWQDLYLSNERGQFFPYMHNQFFRNHGGWFENITEETGTAFPAWSMGVGIGDFSGTGWEDIYCTNIGTSGYFIHHGNYEFQLATQGSGLANSSTGWAAPMFDFDNDGLIDMYVANNVWQGNRLYRNVGSFPPPDVAAQAGVQIHHERPYTHVTALADINHNGALDLVIGRMNHPQTPMPNSARLFLFVNNEGVKRNWLKLDIKGKHPNWFAVGALVDIRVGQTWQHRQVAGGNDYTGENHKVVHFGLGDAAVVDEVRVRWPSGEQRILTNVDANQLLVVDMPGLGDLSGNGKVGVPDLLLMLQAWGDCAFPSKCPADLNGDGKVGVPDVLLLLGNWSS